MSWPLTVPGARSARFRQDVADDQDALAARRSLDRELPVLCRREITEKPLDRMYIDGGVECRTIACAFAGMIADTAVYRGRRLLQDGSGSTKTGQRVRTGPNGTVERPAA